MPRVLIAGCGYVGRAAADLFHHAGWEVEGWTATAGSTAELAQTPYTVRTRDVSQASDVTAADHDFHVVVQCVSSRGGGEEDYRRVYLRGAGNLLRAFPDARLIFTSSTGVYPQCDGGWVTEESAAEPTRPTARVLRETEQLVLAAGGVVMRAAGIYGPGRSFLLQRFLAGEPFFDPASDRFINQVHRDDLAAALFFVAGGEQRRGEIFNVADGSPISARECYEWLARHFGQLHPSTTKVKTTGRRGETNKRVSNAKLRALGWEPRYPTFEAGMTESVIPSWAT
ncbi:MAG: NAD-dependent epimerase/dehydratase family protein [Chthoniobacterales bacterium]